MMRATKNLEVVTTRELPDKLAADIGAAATSVELRTMTFDDAESMKPIVDSLKEAISRIGNGNVRVAYDPVTHAYT